MNPVLPTTAPVTASLQAEQGSFARKPMMDPKLATAEQQQAGQFGITGGALANVADKPLIFKYSESKATGVWLNKTRMLGLSRLGGTVSKGLSGLLEGSTWRVASSITGIMANLSYFIWGASNQGRRREMALAHGDWQHENGVMSQTSAGQLPKEAFEELESVFTTAELPKNSVKISYDSTVDQTKISVASEFFPLLQTHMRDLLATRQAAVELLHDDRLMVLQKKADRSLIQAISLQGIAEKNVDALRGMIEKEWKIPVLIAQMPEGRMMMIPENYRDKFSDERDHSPRNIAETIRLNAKQEQAAGFWEALVHPEKYPVQFGTNLGGLVSNVFGIIAAAKGDRKSKEKPLVNEMLSNVISQMAYIIEAQREISPPIKRDNAIQGDGKSSVVDRLLSHASENPMMASTPFKLASLYYRTVDAYQNNSNSKKSVAFFDALTTLISFTITKRDYGR